MSHEIMIREPELYFDSIHQELDNFLRDTFFAHTFGNPLNIMKNTILRPAIEVTQNKENYKVKVQLPGICKDNIDVEMDNDFMTISAETREEKEEKKEEEQNLRYHTSEFRYGKYQRTISFDQPVKTDEATADYKNGVLTVIVPKQKVEETKPKKLTINYKE